VNSRQTTSRREVPLGVSAVRSPRSCPVAPLCRFVPRRWNFYSVFHPSLPRPPGVFKTTFRTFHIREDVGQLSESLGIEFNASGDRSICVGALNQQDRHGTLLVDLLPQGHIAIRDLAGQKIGSDYGKIKCHVGDIQPLLHNFCWMQARLVCAAQSHLSGNRLLLSWRVPRHGGSSVLSARRGTDETLAVLGITLTQQLAGSLVLHRSRLCCFLISLRNDVLEQPWKNVSPIICGLANCRRNPLANRPYNKPRHP